MNICSMTGYAVHTYNSTAGTITVEIKSVNSRFLDIQFKINDELRASEATLREAITARVTRGKVECRVSFGRASTTPVSTSLNIEVLNTLAQLQDQVRHQFVDAAPLSVHQLLNWPGLIQNAIPEPEDQQSTLQTDTLAAAQTALNDFIDARVREGAALRDALELRITAMQAIVTRITPSVPQVIAQFQQRALARMQEALGLNLTGQVDVTASVNLSREEAMERVRQEVTLYGIRIDIAEELSRLAAHLVETRHILEQGGPVGKRLDFMMQELNREANTVGSKAAIKELADASMELKLLIDQMREQVQNLE